jgi:glycosyltransferase involved in cell wall biosynthesis
MVDKMAKLLNNKELRLSMGHQGKRRVIEEFSTEKMIGQYFELYQSLIKS